MKPLKVMLVVLTTAVFASADKLQCKCAPNEVCWPSQSDWTALNTTLSGALIQGRSPASVCYPAQPDYNEEACATIRTRWFDSTFHASDPVSIDYPTWTNNSCNPIYPNGTSVTGNHHAGEKGCSVGAYPAYVVNATTSYRVAKALIWAGKKNIRVVVKATGHSYTGRSIGHGSLSIWTHNLRGMDYIEDYEPKDCPAAGAFDAVRVAAGHNNGEIQAYLGPYGKVIVSGTNPSVGIVGWLTGGGHGYLSSTYGMGSDNLLEASLILPSGEVITANPCLNTDLFFAIRGGGGGTFGVVTSVVLKTHPSPQTTMHIFSISSLPDTTETEFWDAMGWLHTQLQRLKDGGMAGYYYIVGPPAHPSLSFLWSFMLFDKPAGTVEELMRPIEAYLTHRADLFAYTSNTTSTLTYFDIAQAFPNEAVANGGSAYGSRLLSSSSLSSATANAEALRSVGPSSDFANPNGPISNPTLIGHMIAPFAPPSYFPQLSSLNPAWRNTLIHLVIVETWQDGISQDTISKARADVTLKTQILRALSPDMGAYFNEADANEPDWQGSFFGGNYAALKRVKRGIDPGRVLWCRRCVGSEGMVERRGGGLCAVRGGDGGFVNGEGGRGGKDEL